MTKKDFANWEEQNAQDKTDAYGAFLKQYLLKDNPTPADERKLNELKNASERAWTIARQAKNAGK